MKNYDISTTKSLMDSIWENHFNTTPFMDKTRHLDPQWKKHNKERIEVLIEKEEKNESI